jgi:hypothetical protein
VARRSTFLEHYAATLFDGSRTPADSRLCFELVQTEEHPKCQLILSSSLIRTRSA